MSRRQSDEGEEQYREGAPERKPGPPPVRRPRPDEEDAERPRRRRPSDEGEDDGYTGVVPYRNGFALASYYLGFLGLVAILGGVAYIIFTVQRDPFAAIQNATLINLIYWGGVYGLGGVSALLAITFGAIGASRAGEKKGMAHAIIGIVLGALEIVLLILLLIGVFGVMARR